MDPTVIHSKQHHLYGLEALGQWHPDYARLKRLVERKFDPSIRANLTAEDKREMHRLVLIGADWIQSKPPPPTFNELFRE